MGIIMRHDAESAWMVEDVLRTMFVKGYRAERELLIMYYPEGLTMEDIGKELGISRRGVGRHRKPAAELVFTEQWSESIQK